MIKWQMPMRNDAGVRGDVYQTTQDFVRNDAVVESVGEFVRMEALLHLPSHVHVRLGIVRYRWPTVNTNTHTQHSHSPKIS